MSPVADIIHADGNEESMSILKSYPLYEKPVGKNGFSLWELLNLL